MPLNTLRLNHQPSSHPNERIVFIKPLPRPPAEKSDYDTAELILKAIAAQCLPIMKNHHLSVTTLEEHEPNSEFIGRNFNNGEIIQLVIRSKSGQWLPQNMIQMVMMHELAHNLHMNHGKGFWQSRNLFAGEVKQLWAKGYTGEGLWGRGQTLSTIRNAVGDNVVRSEELADLPVCGGTFRSRRRKRKGRGGGEDLTWKEKRDRRIEKKFGKNGMALGDDEDKRLALEVNSKGPLGVKPRVAKSKRGRELRAAAALARFDTNKKEVEELDQVKDEDDTDEDEYDEVDADQPDATDTTGSKLLDSKGHSMIKVCEDEDNDDVNVKQEMEELGSLDKFFAPKAGSETETASEEEDTSVVTKQESMILKADNRAASSNTSQVKPTAQSSASIPTIVDSETVTTTRGTVSCPVCTTVNSRMNSTCEGCANVLDPRKDPHHWRCTSEVCQDNAYVNAGDYGVCGVCGGPRPS